MNRALLAFLLMSMPCQIPAVSQTAPQPAELTRERVAALAKIYFRDSEELPMDVAVTNVVTDPQGNVKRRSQSAVRVMYKGFNQQAGRSSFNANSGWFNTGALRASLSGDFAVDIATMRLAVGMGGGPPWGIQPPAAPGQPYLLTSKDSDCPAFQLLRDWIFPAKLCAAFQYSLDGSGPENLAFAHFRFDLLNVPAPAKLPDFGQAQITSFRCEGDFQKAFLPGDSQPYLLPSRVVTTVETSKGRIELTNQYSPRAAK